jgi:hypothetical protein
MLAISSVLQLINVTVNIISSYVVLEKNLLDTYVRILSTLNLPDITSNTCTAALPFIVDYKWFINYRYQDEN